jgi:hypothetical protein
MQINLYIKNNECVGYSPDDLSKAIDYDTVIIIDGSLEYPWVVEAGLPRQLSLSELTEATHDDPINKTL